MSRVFVVIPAYNEESKIGEVVKKLKYHGYTNVVVVDDCSQDSTWAVANAAGAMVLRHVINRGQGAALQTGIKFSLRQGAQYIITFDADGQHCVEDIPDMLEPVLSGEAEVSLGSRFLNKKSNVPPIKKLFLKGGILFTYLFSGIKLTDTHNGFRVFSRRAAQRIRITQDRMEHASEIIDQIHRKRILFKEVPVRIRYTKYSRGKGQPVSNSFSIVFRLLMRKIMR